jgi:integrase
MPRTPKYRKRKDRDSAYVEMDGQRIGLPGRAGSRESWDAYRRLLNDYLLRHSAGKPNRSPPRPKWDITIAELVAAWLDHCKVYYATANTRSNEYQNCRYAVRPLVAVCGDWHVVDFGPDQLKEVRQAMITGGWTSPAAKQPVKPWPRTHVNASVNRIKRMFRWGLDAGMVSPEVSAIVSAVAPLAKGRTFAAETKPAGPVPATVVDATLPHLSAVIRTMVTIQRLTGIRSDNLCALRPCDVDRSGPVWIYRPPAHKGEYRDDTLAVPLGPRCQAALRPYLERLPDQPCFNPREVVGRAVGRRAPGDRYTTGTYRNAIRRACRKAGLPHWYPHQLRHATADAAKRARGLDGARAYLGHAAVKTTEIYEARDLALACEIAREIG